MQLSSLSSTKQPLYFKSNGDFVSSIGSFGNSNNEFTNIQTIMIDGKMYRLVDAVDFIEFAQMGNSARMKEVASKLTDDSNPVLVVVSLK